ncbi:MULTISPECIES: recombinase family protein [Deinococcus]|uniref:DNA invertase Pin-like site-specific DNA recombinase n=3 Tax=Deinococcus TaxID=1298 RepID=A0ACC6KPI3_9DEIO|nr:MULTISPECIES: recombinase family protein [Deinococcus]MDR6221288.1 DNA invertase Pin-like site-specific DNA recombinase [Deinococcus soli (ex Cha et al. 2016)]MDR6331221.1 DNA invertase Pin-like site-specific DNA recombinase [Deinococcus soli (ex Cha et al. 2016)]MDR6754438.1 DNA invertase Pin-like site-specific DNA recombinase [Deinococcus soli (ex Cha et al. 2016)]
MTATAFFTSEQRRVQMGQLRSAALYCRVSTGDQSCERQSRDLQAFAERGGFEVVAVFKETASGTVTARSERTKVIQLARDRRIEAVLVTELTRWGRSTTDLLHTLQELEAYGVSLVAQTGLQFDLRSPQGKLFASLMSALAEFERDLLRERIRSGIAAAQERGVKFGRQKGQRVKADRYETRVMALKRAGKSYRAIAAELHLSKNTVMDIIHRVNDRKNSPG